MTRFAAGLAGSLLALFLATTALAWGPLTVTNECVGDDIVWTITADQAEENATVEISLDIFFSVYATVDLVDGWYSFIEPLAQDVWVRWASDPATVYHGAFNGDCPPHKPGPYRTPGLTSPPTDTEQGWSFTWPVR